MVRDETGQIGSSRGGNGARSFRVKCAMQGTLKFVHDKEPLKNFEQENEQI